MLSNVPHRMGGGLCHYSSTSSKAGADNVILKLLREDFAWRSLRGLYVRAAVMSGSAMSSQCMSCRRQSQK
jgi:hypothetical protein